VNAAGLTATAPVLDHRLRAAIAYMREHVSEPIAVEDVANLVGLSRGHFFSLFRDQLNTTPQVFWSAVRVEEAVRLLVQQEEPLTSVALDLGFSTPGNFSRFFRETGVTPSSFGARPAPVPALDDRIP
jgi:transcriptional regulator GlxA family with amidase domain